MTMETRRQRVTRANEFLRAISEHGRRFFHDDGRVAHFKLDMRGRVWFIDSYSEARIWTHQEGGWGLHFTGGGTLLDLCKALRDYIMGKRCLPLNHLGPWRSELCGGDLWGYGDDMQLVRNKCKEL